MEEVIWVSGETAHTCAACWAMSGRRFKIDEVTYDHPNGRCQLSPYLPELEEFNPDAYNHDTEAEFNRLTEDEQKNILGKTGFDLWKKGEAKLSDFAEIKDNDIWGRQIGLKSAESLKKKRIKTEKLTENIPVKEKYSEKPTENSKAKKTEKIPEKYGKKTASELTNDDKKSYNISVNINKLNKIIPLNEKIIDKVQQLNFSFLSKEENAKLTSIRIQLLFKSMKNKNKEVGLVTDLKFNEFEDFVIGSEYEVTVPITSADCYIIHNHPNNSGMSKVDFESFIQHENIRGMIIFGHNDSVFFVRKTENYNHDYVEKDFSDYKNWHKKELDKLTESEKCRKFIEWSTYFEVSRNENGKIRWR